MCLCALPAGDAGADCRAIPLGAGAGYNLSSQAGIMADMTRQTISDVLLEARHLAKSFKHIPVVRDLSLQVRAGECLGIIGPNGAGKTTTIRMLLGLVQPDAGEITVAGFTVPQQAYEARARMGVVSQFDSLDPDFTATENLLVYGRYFGLKDPTIRQRVPGLLALARLENKADAAISALSGGMKRRLSLARALINDPDLVVLDEPTTGLDPQARHLMWDQLKSLTHRGKGILLTTHFMDEAERLCHRLMVLDHGQVIAEGAPRELIAQHLEPQVIEVFGPALPAMQPVLASLASRHEVSGDTLFCYCTDPQPLLVAVQGTALRVLQRPANLEDLFLKLTGRQLREEGGAAGSEGEEA